MDGMSFTSKVKEEIASNVYESKERLKALFSAFIRVNGTLSLRNQKTIIVLESYNAKIAKFLYEHFKNVSLIENQVSMNFIKRKNLKKGVCYRIEINDSKEQVLDALEVSYLEGKIPRNIVNNDDTISGYLAGCFLASGSINSPSSSNYHLEMSFNNENYAKWVSRLFARYKNTNIEPKIVFRRNKYIVYVKKSDKISDFLLMIGAVNCCMEFESVRVDRDYINSSNRLTNLDTANMSKTVKSSSIQIENINKIKNKLGFNNISNPKIKLLCKLRLENETASMEELSYLMSDKLGVSVSKSNIAHLFRKINEIAKSLD